MSARKHEPISREVANEFAINRAVAMLGMDCPTPVWFKWARKLPDDRYEFRMLWLNRAYESQFLAPMGLTTEDYLDHTDFDVHPKEVAQEYYDNDLGLVRRPDRVLKTIEPVFDGSKLYIVKSCHDIDGRLVLRGEAHRLADILGAMETGGKPSCCRPPG